LVIFEKLLKLSTPSLYKSKDGLFVLTGKIYHISISLRG